MGQNTKRKIRPGKNPARRPLFLRWIAHPSLQVGMTAGPCIWRLALQSFGSTPPTAGENAGATFVHGPVGFIMKYYTGVRKGNKKSIYNRYPQCEIMKVRISYRNGGSTGINIPAEFGIRPGTHMIITELKGKIILEELIK